MHMVRRKDRIDGASTAMGNEFRLLFEQVGLRNGELPGKMTLRINMLYPGSGEVIETDRVIRFSPSLKYSEAATLEGVFSRKRVQITHPGDRTYRVSINGRTRHKLTGPEYEDLGFGFPASPAISRLLWRGMVDLHNLFDLRVKRIH
jgi:hypothetical protein